MGAFTVGTFALLMFDVVSTYLRNRNRKFKNRVLDSLRRGEDVSIECADEVTRERSNLKREAAGLFVFLTLVEQKYCRLLN